jgi:hypothetical protein
MANTIDFNVNTNAVTVLNQTATAADNTAQQFTNAKTELRELQKQMLSMDASSAEFQKAAARAGELKDQMADTADAIRTSTGPALESMNNTFSIMSGQIANLDFGGLGQSLTSLGGAVSKINIKSLKDELGGLVKGLGNLAGAIISNPLLALGGAVALLVVNFDKINAALSGTTEKIEKLGEANVALEKQNQILDAQLIKEKALYGESFKTLELEKEKALNNVAVAENELEIARTTGDINTIREKENKLIETRNLLSGITAAGEADRKKLVEEAKNLTIEGYKEEQERAKAIAKFEDARAQQLAVIAEKQRLIKANLQKEELIGTEQQYTTERANFVEKDIETKKVLVQSERQKQLQAELNQLVEEEQILRNAKLAIATGTTVNELKKQEAELQKDLNKDKKEEVKIEEKKAEVVDNSAEEFRAAYNAISDIAKQQSKENELRLLSEKDKELQINKEKYDALIAEADLRGIDTTTFLEAQLATEAEIKKKYADKELEDAKKLAEDKLAAEQAAFNVRIGLVSSGLQSLGALNEAFTKKGQKESKRQFQIQKSLNLASAVVDTYGGINRALNDKTMPSTTARIIQASIVGAMGLANVLKISKTEYGNDSAPSGTNMSTGGGGVGTSAPSPANFAFVGNQPNQQQPPLQAYVVGTQVSSNLEAQQLIQNQSRLGG